MFCERFWTCLLNENHPEQLSLCLHESFWDLRITGCDPEDQRDTTVPCTLMCPIVNFANMPLRTIFLGEMGIFKAIKVSLHYWEDQRLRLQQWLCFPVSKLLRQRKCRCASSVNGRESNALCEWSGTHVWTKKSCNKKTRGVLNIKKQNHLFFLSLPKAVFEHVYISTTASHLLSSPSTRL